jgi:hypothetical protein
MEYWNWGHTDLKAALMDGCNAIRWDLEFGYLDHIFALTLTFFITVYKYTALSLFSELG